METKDYPLGSTFEHNGAMLIVVDDSENKCCEACYFHHQPCNHLNCTSDFRDDGNDVRFEKLEDYEKVQG